MANFSVVPVEPSKYNTPRVVLVDSTGAPVNLGSGSGVTPDAAKAVTSKVSRRTLRGINVSGAEFTSVGTPQFDVAGSFRFLAGRGHTLVRLPFLWESIQPTLGGALDTAALAALKAAVKNAASAGLSVILDVHNYAAYGGVTYGNTGSFTQANFVDLWTKLSTQFKNDPAVVGYGLMNEPRNIPTVNSVTGNVQWQQAQQAALNAIRANGDVTCVLVSGYTAASMGGWLNATNGQPTPYITDSVNNFRWEAHHYWDSGNSGQYTSTYAQAVSAGFGSSQGDAARTRYYFELDQWLTWLKDNGQKGYIGEFGWPSAENGDTPADAAAWNSLADMYLNRIDQEDGDLAWFTAWATGDRWTDGYNLQYYESTTGVLSTPLSNAATLEKHLGTLPLAASSSLAATYAPLRDIASTVTANGTLAANRHTPVDATSGNITVTLPTGQVAGSVISVEKTDATANTVIVSGSIRGSASTITLVGQFEAVMFQAKTGGSWWPIAGHKTKAWLDATYTPQTRTVAGHALTSNVTLAKADVSLGNVDNTSDVNKPVSTAQQTALDNKVNLVAGYAMTFAPRVGQFAQPTGMNSSSTGTIVNQRTNYTPFFVGTPWTMDAFKVHVATAAVGGAGLAFDMALYKDDGTGWPNTAQQIAVSPAASIDLTSTGGKTATLTTPVVLTPGLYWVANLYQYTTVPTTAPQLACISGCSWALPITNGLNVGTVARGINLATQTTLPSTGTLNSALTTFSGATDCPVVAIRRSA